MMAKKHTEYESTAGAVGDNQASDTVVRESRIDPVVGMICVLTNPSFPQFVKIGYCDDAEHYLSDLNASWSVPYPFHLYATYATPEHLADQVLHELIDRLELDLYACDRQESRMHVRGFFEISPEDVYDLLETIACISGTANELRRYNTTVEELQDTRDAEESRRREPFRFSMIDLRPGTSIQYIHDSSLQIRIKDDRHVEYAGKTYSLIGLAQELKGDQDVCSGTRYFTYLGDTLLDLRDQAGTDE